MKNFSILIIVLVLLVSCKSQSYYIHKHNTTVFDKGNQLEISGVMNYQNYDLVFGSNINYSISKSLSLQAGYLFTEETAYYRRLFTDAKYRVSYLVNSFDISLTHNYNFNNDYYWLNTLGYGKAFIEENNELFEYNVDFHYQKYFYQTGVAYKINDNFQATLTGKLDYLHYVTDRLSVVLYGDYYSLPDYLYVSPWGVEFQATLTGKYNNFAGELFLGTAGQFLKKTYTVNERKIDSPFYITGGLSISYIFDFK